jgi:hypothetical protein
MAGQRRWWESARLLPQTRHRARLEVQFIAVLTRTSGHPAARPQIRLVLNEPDRPCRNAWRLDFDRPAAVLAPEQRGTVSRISGTFRADWRQRKRCRRGGPRHRILVSALRSQASASHVLDECGATDSDGSTEARAPFTGRGRWRCFCRADRT